MSPWQRHPTDVSRVFTQSSQLHCETLKLTVWWRAVNNRLAAQKQQQRWRVLETLVSCLTTGARENRGSLPLAPPPTHTHTQCEFLQVYELLLGVESGDTFSSRRKQEEAGTGGPAHPSRRGGWKQFYLSVNRKQKNHPAPRSGTTGGRQAAPCLVRPRTTNGGGVSFCGRRVAAQALVWAPGRFTRSHTRGPDEHGLTCSTSGAARYASAVGQCVLMV